LEDEENIRVDEHVDLPLESIKACCISKNRSYDKTRVVRAVALKLERINLNGCSRA
jgi:hypothetical protein